MCENCNPSQFAHKFESPLLCLKFYDCCLCMKEDVYIINTYGVLTIVYRLQYLGIQSKRKRYKLHTNSSVQAFAFCDSRLPHS